MRVTSSLLAAMAVFVLLGIVPVPAEAGAASAIVGRAFYSYTGSTPLAEIQPGTVLHSRTLSYHVLGVPLPVRVVQLLYRSTGDLGQPTTNVTSVIEPPGSPSGAVAVAYQSFYDSLNPADEPSAQIAGDVTLGGLIPNGESLFIAPELLQGIPVIVADTEGQQADLGAGTVYGMNTLDSIRAATTSALTGLSTTTNVGMIGYSGGAIATDWAAQLAPTYAPAVNQQLVGAAEGGVLVDPAHNVSYISGSLVWAPIMVVALIGISRAAGIDLTPYLSSYGLQLFDKLQHASILTVTGEYPGLTWAELVKPRYANPDSIPIFVQLANELDMGSAPSPTTPMFIGQGANGILEGTAPGPPGIGPGDGVMVAGDVRSLAREFCASGTTVDYTQYNSLSHLTAAAVWAPSALLWLSSRFARLPSLNNCATIAPGNSLAPQRVSS